MLAIQPESFLGLPSPVVPYFLARKYKALYSLKSPGSFCQSSAHSRFHGGVHCLSSHSPSDPDSCFHSTLGYGSLWWGTNVWPFLQDTTREGEHRCTDICHFPQGPPSLRSKPTFPSRESSIDLGVGVAEGWGGRGNFRHLEIKLCGEVSCRKLLLSSLWHVNIPPAQRSRGPSTFLNVEPERGIHEENINNTSKASSPHTVRLPRLV